MSLQDWVEMRSWEVQTKEKRLTVEKGRTGETTEEQRMIEPREEWPEAVGGATGVALGGAEEVVEAEVPLVQKKRRLVKAGQAESGQGNVIVEATGSDRGGADQAAVGLSGEQGTAAGRDEG